MSCRYNEVFHHCASKCCSLCVSFIFLRIFYTKKDEEVMNISKDTLNNIAYDVLGLFFLDKKVQVGKDQEKAQSEKDSHSKNRGGKKPNQQSGTYTMKHIASRMSSYFPNRWPLSYLNLTKNMKTHIRRQSRFVAEKYACVNSVLWQSFLCQIL